MTYNEILEPYMKEMDFDFQMERVNEALITQWPCCMCFTFGYLFCPCTLGNL